MIDPIDHPPPTPPTRTALKWATLAVRGLLAALAAVGVWFGSQWALARPTPAVEVLLPVALMTLVVGAFGLEEWRWRRPRRRLLSLLEEIRGGRMPIESLEEARGGIAPVSRAIGEILHDNRAMQRKFAELDAELSQRVQNRTDALQRVIGSLRMQAIRDPLTQLFNRRALDELLPRLIDHCRAAGQDVSLLMMDLDHFKQLNDQLGHAAGDEMLRSVGQIIRSSLGRARDCAFRCGGDEFVIVLCACPPRPARQLADRLSSLVATLARTLKSSPRPSLSIGVASLSELPSPLAGELLREADKRLYVAKQESHQAAA